MSRRRRLGRLEKMNPGEERLPRSPKYVYDRMREEARESNAEHVAEGDEPLYEIAASGDILTRDGRTVNHYGDFIGALDRRIAKLEAEIEEETKERSS